MKKLLVFWFAFMLLPIASAQPFKIGLSKNYIEVFSDEMKSVNLTIENLQERQDLFRINVIPPSFEKVSVSIPPALTIDANSSAVAEIFFYAQPDAEQTFSPLVFKLIVSSLAINAEEAEEIRVNVLRKAPVYIYKLEINKDTFNPTETVRITITLHNTANRLCEDYFLETAIKKENETIKVFREDISVPAKSMKDYTFEYTLGKYAPYGTYVIISSLKNKSEVSLYEKKLSFNVRAVPKIPSEYTEKRTEIKFLATYVTIKIKNEGNIPTGEFYIRESIPFFAKDFFEPESKPISQQLLGKDVIYTWAVHSLEPGEEVEIKYRIVLWKAYVLLAAIIVAVYATFKYAFGVSLTKTYPISATKEKEIAINLEVKNKGINEIKDVYVADFLPSNFKLLSKFGTAKPYSVKEREKGTALMWKFDSLKGREEVVLVYNAKALTDVKKLELPKAKLMYVTKGGKKKVILSRNFTKQSF
jgi:hypothetical protein